MPDYITIPELKYTLELSGTAYVDGDLLVSIPAASRAIDNICDRTFYPMDGQTRYYSGSGDGYLPVTDIRDVTTLKTDTTGDGTFETTWAATDYVLEPLNALLDGEPYSSIRVSRAGRYTFPDGLKSVEIVGDFGWAACPAPVKEATSMLATKLIRVKREAPFGFVTVGLEVGAAIRIARNDPTISMLLEDYNRTVPLVA